MDAMGKGKFLWYKNQQGHMYYEGELKDGLYHGMGRLVTNNKVVEGRWEKGILVGR